MFEIESDVTNKIELGYPSFQIQVQNLPSNQVQITVNQTQSHPSVSFFEMPLTIRLLGADYQQANIVLNNTNNNQVFTENVPFTVTAMIFDTEKQLITKNNLVTLDTLKVELNGIIRLFLNIVSAKLNVILSPDVVTKSIDYGSNNYFGFQ